MGEGDSELVNFTIATYLQSKDLSELIVNGIKVIQVLGASSEIIAAGVSNRVPAVPSQDLVAKSMLKGMGGLFYRNKILRGIKMAEMGPEVHAAQQEHYASMIHNKISEMFKVAFNQGLINQGAVVQNEKIFIETGAVRKGYQSQ